MDDDDFAEHDDGIDALLSEDVAISTSPDNPPASSCANEWLAPARPQSCYLSAQGLEQRALLHTANIAPYRSSRKEVASEATPGPQKIKEGQQC